MSVPGNTPVFGAIRLKLNHARELKSLRKRTRLLGFELVDRSSGEVLLNPVS
jgi:hypothetical protein